MGFDRFAAKHAARESMRLNNPNPVLVTLVYYALTTLVSVAISYLLYNPAIEIVQYAAWGYEAEEILDFILREHRQDLYLFIGMQFLFSIYSLFMNFGYTSYALRMARNEQPGIRHLFDGFARPLRVLWSSILMELFTLLRTMAVMLPVSMILALGRVDALSAACIVTTVSMVTMFAVSYRYRLSYYFILDDPDCTARQAVRRSKTTMRGWKWSLFVLDISFVGWSLLSGFLGFLLSLVLPVLITNVLAFWLMPYYFAANANFYDAITGPSQPSGGCAGPDYDYHAKNEGDGPQPF